MKICVTKIGSCIPALNHSRIKSFLHSSFLAFIFLSTISCKTYQVPIEGAPKIGQIYMTNEVNFKNDEHIKYIGSGFLVKYEKALYACTAKHIITKTKRLTQPIKATQLNDSMTNWAMFPRYKEHKTVKLGLLINDEEMDSEWWVLEVEKKRNFNKAIEIREEAVEVGEQVFFVGCPYSQTDCKQNIYVGEIASIQKNRIKISYDPKVNVAGFSGAPLMDKDGKLIGILTQANWDKKNKVHTIVWAESTKVLKEVLKGVN